MGAKAIQYSYDEYGRLKSVSVTTNGANVKESYTYDAEGNRISRTTKGGTVYYVNDACADLTQVIAETDANGTLKKEYTRGLSVISATNGAAETSYFVNDGQGNIRAIVSGGVVADTYRYDAYGNLIEKTGDSDNDLLYNGEQYSEATGLYYLRARYMDPTTGRLISMDAYSGELGNPISLHKYLYANANPVMYCDPSGYYATMGEALTAGAIIGCLSGMNAAAIYCAFDPECDRKTAICRVLLGGAIGALFGVIGVLPEAVAASEALAETVFADIVTGVCAGFEGAGATFGAICSAEGAVESFQKGYTALGFINVAGGVLSIYALGKLTGRVFGPRVGGTSNNELSIQKGTDTTNQVGNGNAAPQYYFRGTTEGYPGNASVQKLGVCPTSTDPAVATVFATNGEPYGNGILYIASASDMNGVPNIPSNVLSNLENEVVFGIQPLEFANRASLSISSSQARGILRGMGYDVPSAVSTGEMSGIFSNMPKLTANEIINFVNTAGGL